MKVILYKVLLGLTASIIPIGITTTTLVSCGHKHNDATFADFKKAAAQESAIKIVQQTKPNGWDQATSSDLKIVSHTDDGSSKYNIKISCHSNGVGQIASFSATYKHNTKYNISAWICITQPTTDLSFDNYVTTITSDSVDHLWSLLRSYDNNHPDAPLPHINANLDVNTGALILDKNKTHYDSKSETNTVIFDLWLKEPNGPGMIPFETELKLRAQWNNSLYQITDWKLSYNFVDYTKTLKNFIQQSYFFSSVIAANTHGTAWTKNNCSIDDGTIDPSNPQKIHFVISHLDNYKITETLKFYAEMITKNKLNNIFGSQLYYNGEIHIENKNGKPDYDYFAYFKAQANAWSNNQYYFTPADLLKTMNGDPDITLPKNWNNYIQNLQVNSHTFTAVLTTTVNPNPDPTNKKVYYTIIPPQNDPNLLGDGKYHRFNVSVVEHIDEDGWLVDLGQGDFKKTTTQPPDVLPADFYTWLKNGETKLNGYKDPKTDDIAQGIENKKNNGSHLENFPNLVALFTKYEIDNKLSGLSAVVNGPATQGAGTSIQFKLNFYNINDTKYQTILGGSGGLFSFNWPGGTDFNIPDLADAQLNIKHDIDPT